MAYATPEQLKARLNWPSGDDSKDEILEEVLEAASRHIDRVCNRSFEKAGAAETRTYNVVGNTVFVDDIAGDTVTVTVDGDEINATPVRGAYGAPYNRLILDSNRYTAVDVEASWGWAATPPEIVEATLILAHRLYKRAETPAGIGGFDQTGAAFRISYRDPDVDALVAPYRRAVLA